MEPMTAIKKALETSLPYVLVDEQRLDLTVHNTAELKLSFAASVWDSEWFLVIDLYSAANPVHPAGHVGWWKLPLEDKGDISVEVSKGADGFNVAFDGVAPEEFWKNPEYLGVDEPVIQLHVVLRPLVSEAVRFDDIIHIYNSPDALHESEERRKQLDHPSGGALSAPWYVWPRESMIHLVSTNAFERDAVGNFALSLYRLFRANGIACQLYASNFDPTLRGTIRHTCELFTTAGEDDVLLMNFSIFEQWMPCLAQLPSKKVLYFHNITPPRFLQVYDAEYAAHCAAGMAQLKQLSHFDARMANSTSSARVLDKLMSEAPSVKPTDVVTSPPIIGAKAWHDVLSEPIDLPPQPTLLLYVGRMAPHKRIEDLFALFQSYHRLDPDSALLVVGGARFDGYVGFLRYLLNNEYADIKDHIHFHDGVSDGQLKTLYERCSAFVTMSEHEGFCVPVVEAMAFDKPVFAYADEAVVETLGRTGRVFYSKDFEAIAHDMRAVLSTTWKQRLIVSGQRERLKQIVHNAVGRAFWAVLEKVLYGARSV